VLSGLRFFVWLIGGSYVDSLEARLDHSEALVRQLRNELANIHFASTSNSTPNHSLNSSTETVEENVGGSEQVDLLNVSLAVILRAIAAPPPPPHADDLLHLELAEKVGLHALPGDCTLILSAVSENLLQSSTFTPFHGKEFWSRPHKCRHRDEGGCQARGARRGAQPVTQ
jgi:hypothetical protein